MRLHHRRVAERIGLSHRSTDKACREGLGTTCRPRARRYDKGPPFTMVVELLDACLRPSLLKPAFRELMLKACRKNQTGL